VRGTFRRLSSSQDAHAFLAERQGTAEGGGLFIDYMGRSFADRDSINRTAEQLLGKVVEPERLLSTWSDKWNTHKALEAAGIPRPATLLCPTDMPAKELEALVVSVVGEPFVVKPRRGSGGRGVCVDARASDLLDVLRISGDNAPLLEQLIEPVRIGPIPAWLRVYHCHGRNWPCFWDPSTHGTRFAPHLVAPTVRDRIEETVSGIAAVTGYSLFSTEVAMTAGQGHELVVVDAANHKPFMGTTSEVGLRGVPDAVAAQIAHRLVTLSLELS
jgi:hypothetical protein